jgi:hypothetical protein
MTQEIPRDLEVLCQESSQRPNVRSKEAVAQEIGRVLGALCQELRTMTKIPISHNTNSSHTLHHVCSKVGCLTSRHPSHIG